MTYERYNRWPVLSALGQADDWVEVSIEASPMVRMWLEVIMRALLDARALRQAIAKAPTDDPYYRLKICSYGEMTVAIAGAHLTDIDAFFHRSASEDPDEYTLEQIANLIAVEPEAFTRKVRQAYRQYMAGLRGFPRIPGPGRPSIVNQAFRSVERERVSIAG